MSEDLNRLLCAAEALQPDLVRIRQELHRVPELGLELPETRKIVLRELAALGLPTHFSDKTSGVLAVLRGEAQVASGVPRKRLLLRADMDALPIREAVVSEFSSEYPGRMHACGHDAHMAILLGAARILSAHRKQIAGDLLFLFQPGEEGLGGAKILLEEGLLEREGSVAAAFAIHMEPSARAGCIESRAGALLAAADSFSITVHGKGGHGSRPHLAVDPIPAACEIVLALQAMLTRSLDATDPSVLTVTQIHAGTTTNVIPAEVQLQGTLRTLSTENRTRLLDGVARVVQGVASAHAVRATFEVQAGYPLTRNDPAFTQFAFEVGRTLFGVADVVELPAPKLYAEDFSYILEKIPGAMFFLGASPQDGEVHPVHSDRMRMDETVLCRGVALHAALALRFLVPTL